MCCNVEFCFSFWRQFVPSPNSFPVFALDPTGALPSPGHLTRPPLENSWILAVDSTGRTAVIDSRGGMALDFARNRIATDDDDDDGGDDDE